MTFIRLFNILWLSILVCTLSAQVGGDKTYRFLSLPSSARVSSLGGSLVSAGDGNISLAYENPALIIQDMDQEIVFQHQFLLAGVQTGYASFGKWISSQKLMTYGGIKYILYGDFDRTDERGNLSGTFKGNEVALQLGASYQLYDKVRLGAAVKYINGSLDVYRSSALAFDLGAYYQDTSGLFSAGISIRNLGMQIGAYNTQRESLPLDISLGLSRRLRHLPFRLSIVYHHAQRWNLLYDDPNNEENAFFGGFQTADNQPTEIDNFFRHLIFGGEILMGKNEVFKIRLGYNHQRKQELSVTSFRTLTGFSVGFGIKVKKLQFDYGLSKIHFGGSIHHLGVSTKLKRFTSPQILN